MRKLLSLFFILVCGAALAQNSQVRMGTAAGTDSYTVFFTPAVTSLNMNTLYSVIFTNANTGASTIVMNSISAKDIFQADGDVLEAGDIPAGSTQILAWNGTNFRLVGSSSSGGGAFWPLAGTGTLTGATTIAGAGNNLTLSGGGDFSLTPASGKTINLETDGATMFLSSFGANLEIATDQLLTAGGATVFFSATNDVQFTANDDVNISPTDDLLFNGTSGTTGQIVGNVNGHAQWEAAPSGGHVIEDEGTPLTQQSNLNFTGAGVAVTDAGGKTVVTIGSAAGAWLLASGGTLTGTNTITGGSNTLTFTGIGAYSMSSTSTSLTSAGATTITATGSTNDLTLSTSSSGDDVIISSLDAVSVSGAGNVTISATGSGADLTLSTTGSADDILMTPAGGISMSTTASSGNGHIDIQTTNANNVTLTTGSGGQFFSSGTSSIYTSSFSTTLTTAAGPVVIGDDVTVTSVTVHTDGTITLSPDNDINLQMTDDLLIGGVSGIANQVIGNTTGTPVWVSAMTTLDNVIASTGNVTTGEDQLFSYTVPAATLATNGHAVGGRFSGIVANNANTKTIRVKFGSTTIATRGTTTPTIGQGWTIDWECIRTGATTQRCSCTFSGSDGLASAYYATAGETLSGTVAVVLTGDATATDDIVMHTSKTYFRP